MLALHTKGAGIVTALYYLSNLFSSTTSIYIRTTGRIISPFTGRAIIVALMVAYILPAIVLQFASAVSLMQLRTVASLTVPLITTIMGSMKRDGPDNTAEPTVELYEKREMPYLRAAYATTLAATLLMHVYMLSQSTLEWSSLRALFAAGWEELSIFLQQPAGADAALLVRRNFVIATSAMGLYCLYTLVVLRRQGYLTTSKALGAAIAFLSGCVAVGPGVAYTSFWWWREETIAALAS